jgi:hypothetical protein
MAILFSLIRRINDYSNLFLFSCQAYVQDLETSTHTDIDMHTHTEEKTDNIGKPFNLSSKSNMDYTVAAVENSGIIPGLTGLPELKIPEPGGELGFEGEDGGSKKHLNIKAAILAADALSLLLDTDSLPSLPSLPCLPCQEVVEGV